MIDIEKIKMEPLVLYKKENGKFGIINGCNKFKILKILGVTELQPEMYNYSDNLYKKDIVKITNIEDEYAK